MITAIKSLQKPYAIDPLVRYDYDSFVIESFQRQRSSLLNKKSLQIGSTKVLPSQQAKYPQEATNAAETSTPSTRRQFNDQAKSVGTNLDNREKRGNSRAI